MINFLDLRSATRVVMENEVIKVDPRYIWALILVHVPCRMNMTGSCINIS